MRRVLLYGCGRIARRHAELLSSSQLPQFEIAGFCDLVEERAREFSEEFGAPYASSIEAVIEKNIQFDLVAILTESGNHASHVEELAPLGADLIVEKPLALRVEDVDKAFRSSAKAGVQVFEVKQNRYNAPVEALRSAIDSGLTGKALVVNMSVLWSRDDAYYSEAPWRRLREMDGGVVGNQAIHHLDMLLWLFGPARKVFARGATFSVDIEAEDSVVATIELASGTLVSFVATNAVRPKNFEAALTAIFENGTVRIGGVAVNEVTSWTVPSSQQGVEPRRNGEDRSEDVYGSGHLRFYQEISRALEGSPAALVEALEARHTVEVFEAIQKSILTGQVVELL